MTMTIPHSGMLPHKLPRGAAALKRLKVYEGIPPPYDKKKRMTVPSALRAIRLSPRRKVNPPRKREKSVFYFFQIYSPIQFCELSRISSEIGWKYREVVDTLEAKRKAKSKVHHDTKKTEFVSGRAVLEIREFNERDNYGHFSCRNFAVKHSRTAKRKLRANRRSSRVSDTSDLLAFFQCILIRILLDSPCSELCRCAICNTVT